MIIKEVTDNNKKYMKLLFLAGEQEDMIEKYLDRGTMYAECVVTDEGNGLLEIKNIATLPDYQGKGYGRLLIQFIQNKYKVKYIWSYYTVLRL